MKPLPGTQDMMLRQSVTFLILSTLFLAGCVISVPTDFDPSNTPWPDENVRIPPPLGSSVEGRLIRCSVLGSGPETVLILAGIHGDEPAGTVLTRMLRYHLVRHPALFEGKTVVIVPALNPDGLTRNQRRNAHEVDLNRNFDSRNRKPVKGYGKEPLSEPEARFITELIRRYQPGRIVSLHQPLACVDWDGPGRELAKVLAEACGLPMKKLGAKPGSLGSYAGVDLRIPIVTLELPGDATRMDPNEVWEKYGEAMLAVIRYDPSSARGILAK
jgi:protein MpaA